MRRSQKRKNDSQVVNLFMLLGSMSVKAADKMLMKLTLDESGISIKLVFFVFQARLKKNLFCC